MAEIEPVGEAAKATGKLLKGKYALVLVGGAAAVGLFAYFKNQSSAAAQPAVSSPDNSQVTQAITQQNQALASGLQSIVTQENEAMAQAFQNFGSQLATQQDTFKSSVEQQIGSLVDKVSQISSAALPSSAPATTPAAPAAQTTRYFVGNSVDLASAAAEKGGSGVGYFNTENMTDSQIHSFLASHPDAVVVGGTAVVSKEATAGLANLRLAGDDRNGTRQAIAEAQF